MNTPWEEEPLVSCRDEILNVLRNGIQSSLETVAHFDSRVEKSEDDQEEIKYELERKRSLEDAIDLIENILPGNVYYIMSEVKYYGSVIMDGRREAYYDVMVYHHANPLFRGAPTIFSIQEVYADDLFGGDDYTPAWSISILKTNRRGIVAALAILKAASVRKIENWWAEIIYGRYGQT